MHYGDRGPIRTHDSLRSLWRFGGCRPRERALLPRMQPVRVPGLLELLEKPLHRVRDGDRTRRHRARPPELASGRLVEPTSGSGRRRRRLGPWWRRARPATTATHGSTPRVWPSRSPSRSGSDCGRWHGSPVRMRCEHSPWQIGFNDTRRQPESRSGRRALSRLLLHPRRMRLRSCCRPRRQLPVPDCSRALPRTIGRGADSTLRRRCCCSSSGSGSPSWARDGPESPIRKLAQTRLQAATSSAGLHPHHAARG